MPRLHAMVNTAALVIADSSTNVVHQLFITDSGPEQHSVGLWTEKCRQSCETMAASTRAVVHVAATLLAQAEVAQIV